MLGSHIARGIRLTPSGSTRGPLEILEMCIAPTSKITSPATVIEMVSSDSSLIAPKSLLV